MFEDFVLMGNADGVAARLRPYADAGLEHVVLADMSSVAAGPDEAARAFGERAPPNRPRARDVQGIIAHRRLSERRLRLVSASAANVAGEMFRHRQHTVRFALFRDGTFDYGFAT